MNITREFVRTVQPHNKDGVKMKRVPIARLKNLFWTNLKQKMR